MAAEVQEEYLHKGWFSEINEMWPGIAVSIGVDKKLFSAKSRYQQIDVYQTRSHGKMLVLDGIIQLTEQDEFAYHEMMAHLPLMAHPNPERVLVIGGGDGGILREAGRHDTVRRMDFCEIDEKVIEVSRRFFPETACGFNDERVHIHIEDGDTFVNRCKSCYDVIIVDSSDPVGPGEALFRRPFYNGLKQALAPGGIICTQGESSFLHPEWVRELSQITRELFEASAYATVIVPTYTGGHISICTASLGPALTVPARPMDKDLQARLKYYSPEVHKAAFALPPFARKLVEA
ncbi:MAG TPA: spermidine synthase [Desulfobacteraceae bacterium]|nr:spermidine synthase [Desulfobacteraceae bacterium]